ncbi:MAG: DUF134 domain-containing protein [Candidatus Ancaeobacter aquaticus]|nr:DUF134 domain-containing protein [Candidatus Ancaeobacter aquaticus]
MRPKKTRWVDCKTQDRCFRPKCKPVATLQGVSLSLDEFEAIRLADFMNLKQEDAAKNMKISRPTFSRIIKSARGKVGDALVNLKALKVEGGCCEITERNK